mgnify:CR=1 FL=1
MFLFLTSGFLASCRENPPNEGGEGGEAPGGLTDADFDSNWDEAIETFDGMDLPEELLNLDDIEIEEAALRVLRFPAVADKSFLIHIGDRTVGGLCVRDQFVFFSFALEQVFVAFVVR